MASCCHIGVIVNDRNRYRMWAYQNNSLHARGINKSRKIVTFSHLNFLLTFYNNNFKVK